MEREEQGENICERVDQLINKDDEFLNNKTKLYCEYCLSLGKKYVDSITVDLYEECENYLKNFSSNKEKEEQFIKSYESKLARKGEEICKEIESYVNNELLVKKAVTYCHFISGQKNDNQDLVDRSQKYIEEVNDFYSYENTFNKIKHDRIERKSWWNMRNKRLKKI